MAKPNPFQTALVKLAVPAHMGSSISIGGFTLEAEDDGTVVVPQEHAAELIQHGFERYVEPAAAKAAAAPAQQQRPAKK